MDPITQAFIQGAAGASGDKTYVDDVFSNWVYKGNNSARNEPNGIDLADKGGLVWIKDRDQTNNHVLFDDFTGVVLETDEGDRIAKALGDKKAAILKNHGLLTTGESVDAALWAFLSMDRCCQSQLLAEAAGQMERITDDVAKLTKTQVGTEMAMWASFQPLYDLMLEKDDSFLN